MMNQELLYKYFKGTASIEEEKQILDWVEASEENRKPTGKNVLCCSTYPCFPQNKTIRKKQYDSCRRPLVARALQRQPLPYPVTT